MSSLHDSFSSWFYMRRNQTPGAYWLPVALPGLRVAWFASLYSCGRVGSLPVGWGMTNAGAATYAVATDWPGVLVPYVSGTYWTLTDSVTVSPTGDMTVGGWFWATTSGAKRGLINKWLTTGNKRAYTLYLDAADAVTFDTSGNGIAEKSVAGSAISTDQWTFVTGRIACGVSQDVCVNGVWTKNTTSVPASVYGNVRSLYVGRWNESGTNYWDGYSAQWWLCGYYVPDSHIAWLFEEQASYFGLT